MRFRARPLLAAGTLVGALSISAGASASTWTVPLVGGSNGEAQGYALPPAPTATAACSGVVLGSIIVSWTAVAPPNTTYTIYKSTTSGTTGFSAIATGVGGTSYTVSGLAISNYWFKVQGVSGTSWNGAQSAATAQRTITLVLCT